MVKDLEIMLRYWLLGIVLVAGQCAYAQKEWTLVWSDEFDVDGRPNPENWGYEYGFVRNEELQWYQPENAVVKDGYLVITAKEEDKPNPNYAEASKDWRKNRRVATYTSSCLLTRGLQSWQYGRFEMRAKIDISAGMWPAFWTLGISEPWPVCGEIDIMEYYSGKILANAAWAGKEWHTQWDSFTKGIDSFESGWEDEFHVWRMDWDETMIRLYVDDLLLNEIDLKSTVNLRGDLDNPMKQPHYILVNLAIGGNNGGDPSDTTFPSTYLIDYVRVYQ